MPVKDMLLPRFLLLPPLLVNLSDSQHHDLTIARVVVLLEHVDLSLQHPTFHNHVLIANVERFQSTGSQLHHTLLMYKLLPQIHRNPMSLVMYFSILGGPREFTIGDVADRLKAVAYISGWSLGSSFRSVLECLQGSITSAGLGSICAMLDDSNIDLQPVHIVVAEEVCRVHICKTESVNVTQKQLACQEYFYMCLG